MEFFDLSAEVEKHESNVIMNTINWGLPLPQHISPVIFSKLPISKLAAFRLISKSWNHLILDYVSSSKFFPKTFIFSTSELDHNYNFYCNPKIHRLDCDTLNSSFEFGFPHEYVSNLMIANHCNGLLFIFKHGYHHHDRVCMGILNPLTTELLKFPIFEYTVQHGFGFSPKTKQYKLFRLIPKGTSYGIEIFRFGRGDQWRPACLPFPLNICSNGAYLDGVIYWLGREIGNENVIYALDVETEKFELIGRILEVGPYSWSGALQSLNGTIYAIINLLITPTCPQFQIWRMRKKDSWICACSFQPFIDVEYDDFNNICLVKTSEDGEIMWFLHGNDLFCLDKCGKMIKRKTLFQNDIYVQYAWPIEFLHFGSLSNILAGVDDYTAHTPFHFI